MTQETRRWPPTEGVSTEVGITARETTCFLDRQLTGRRCGRIVTSLNGDQTSTLQSSGDKIQGDENPFQEMKNPF
jgi:hypothetical protein